VTDHPTPEALAALAKSLRNAADLYERDMIGGPDWYRDLRQAADALEAQQRQLAVARRLTHAVERFLLKLAPIESRVIGERTEDNLAVVREALREALEAGLTENTSAESAPIGKNICGLAEGGDRARLVAALRAVRQRSAAVTWDFFAEAPEVQAVLPLLAEPAEPEGGTDG
jgi:hypothetical protein